MKEVMEAITMHDSDDIHARCILCLGTGQNDRHCEIQFVTGNCVVSLTPASQRTLKALSKFFGGLAKDSHWDSPEGA